jgi:hypothetical protein
VQPLRAAGEDLHADHRLDGGAIRQPAGGHDQLYGRAARAADGQRAGVGRGPG